MKRLPCRVSLAGAGSGTPRAFLADAGWPLHAGPAEPGPMFTFRGLVSQVSRHGPNPGSRNNVCDSCNTSTGTSGTTVMRAAISDRPQLACGKLRNVERVAGE